MIFKLFHFFKSVINLKMGLAGALVMGIIVFFINFSYGWLPACTAAAKQGLYTFLFGGAIIRLLEWMLTQIKNRALSIGISVGVVSLLSCMLVFLVHTFKGTPEPFYSTLPTIIMAPPGFLWLAFQFSKPT